MRRGITTCMRHYRRAVYCVSSLFSAIQISEIEIEAIAVDNFGCGKNAQ